MFHVEHLQITMQIVRMEDPSHPSDRTLGALLLTFPSNRQMRITWRSSKAVDRREMAADILPRVIKSLHDDPTLGGQTDRREFNPASFLAALDGELKAWNSRLGGF